MALAARPPLPVENEETDYYYTGLPAALTAWLSQYDDDDDDDNHPIHLHWLLSGQSDLAVLVLFVFRLIMTMWTIIVWTHFYLEPLTKVVRRSEASHLHVLLIIRPALQHRGDSLQMRKKGRPEWAKLKGHGREKDGMRGREHKGRRGSWWKTAKKGEGGVIQQRAENSQED